MGEKLEAIPTPIHKLPPSLPPTNFYSPIQLENPLRHMHQIYFLKEPAKVFHKKLPRWSKWRYFEMTPSKTRSLGKMWMTITQKRPMIWLSNLVSLLSDVIKAKFNYFSLKTEICYKKNKKTHKFPKNGPKTGQLMLSNYVITSCLV